MKLAVVTVLLYTFVLPNAFAANSRTELKRDLATTLRELRAEVGLDVATESDMTIALEDLKSALETLRHGGTAPSPGLQCVSRDNDGREPYMIARKNEDFSVTPIAGTVLNLNECQDAVASTRRLNGFQITCVSRDNDARGPYSAVAIPKQSGSAPKFAVFGAYAECKQAVGAGQTSGKFFALCAARDNDGRAPFTHVVFNSEDGTVRMTGDVYSTIGDCLAAN
jgi:hypothetical protein